MMQPHCPTHEELQAFCLGDLAGPAFERVARHVSACPDCDATLRLWDEQSDELVTELRRLETVRGTSRAIPSQLANLASGTAKRFLQSEAGDVVADPGRRFARLVANGPCRLGKFYLNSQLGSGSFGYVFRAYDSELDRTVAIKIQRAGSLSGEEEVDRFVREARSAAQLKHP